MLLILRYLVKYIPEWFPGAGFKMKAKEWKKVVTATVNMPFQHVKDAMVSRCMVLS
jgi:hypothetical protein